MKAASLSLIVIGLVMLGLSFVWVYISPKPEGMDEQETEKYMEAVSDMHSTMSAPDAKPKAETEAILDQVDQESKKAQRTEALGKNIFRIGGVLLTLVGAGLFFWQGRTEE